MTSEPSVLLHAHALGTLYLGAAVLGLVGGGLGYLIIQRTWRDPAVRGRRAAITSGAI